MSERFEQLYQMEKNLLSDESPILISAAFLLHDTITNSLIAQLKFHSISSKNIIALKISLDAFDVSGQQLNGVDEYQYLDLNIKNGQDFGQDKAILIPNSFTRAIKIKEITVIFTDNSQWSCNGKDLKSFPIIKKLSDEITDLETIKQYQIETTNQSAFVPQKHFSLWNCSCGTINSQNTCSCCGSYKDKIFGTYNISDLTNRAQERVKNEKLAKEARDEKVKLEAAKSKKQNKLIAVLSSITAFVVVVSLIIAFIVVPETKYNNALKCFDNGSYDEGCAILVDLNGYKNSNELLIKYASVGSSIKFGTYINEKIEWTVLAKQNNKLLVITKDYLTTREYSETENSGGYSWYGSTLRRWLNSNFIDMAFSSAEQAIIKTTTITDTKQPQYGKVYNMETKDKIFLLSADEARTYFSSNTERSIGKTYWLRSVGWQYFCASQVTSSGSIDEEGANITDDFYYVRPAMWIDISGIE